MGAETRYGVQGQPAVLGILPSVLILGAVMVAALGLTVRREITLALDAARRAIAVAVVVQAIHFAEELSTDLHVRLPELFGLPPIPFGGFVAFNVAWIAIWSWSVVGLPNRFAAFAAWFLSLAAVINGIGHPLLAMMAGGYFPGLITSPFIGVAGAWLVLSLYRATAKK